MSDYKFEHNIERAWTLPSDWYTDSDYLKQEQSRVFHSTWQQVGRVDQVAEVGYYFTAEVAGEPIVIARGADKEIRGFYNVCRHRAGPVALEQGNRNTFVCYYHGWTYNLDGSLRNAPEFDGVQELDRCDLALRPVRVEAWGPLLFVNLDHNAPPLSDFLGDIPIRAAEHRIQDMKWVMRKEYDLACNWKVYVDNYLEGYHIPVAHPGLYREIDYEAYRVETFRYHSIQHSPIRGAESKGYRGERQLQPGEKEPTDAQYYWIFPNLMLNIFMGQMQTNLIIPMGHERTKTVFEWYFHNPESPEVREKIDKLQDFSDEVQQEDIFLCEHVQRGLMSRSYDKGRYSAKRENGVHHFHSLIYEYLEKEEG